MVTVDVWSMCSIALAVSIKPSLFIRLTELFGSYVFAAAWFCAK